MGKKKLLLIISFFLVGILFGVPVKAAAPSGINGNGTNGVSININSNPYTSFAQIPTYGKYAYGKEGCAWFASARVNQLTGKCNTILSGWAWYHTQYSNYGFSRGSKLKAPALACYGNHVAVVERVNGNTVTVSQGGMSGLSDANHGYCVISTMTEAKLKTQGGCGTFYGYVYLDTPSNVTIKSDPGIAKTSMNLGETCKVFGNVISSGSEISSVTVGIYTDKSGKNCVNNIKVTKNNLSGYKYDLTKIDSNVHFERITTGGTYYLVVNATTKSGKKADPASKQFTVRGNQCGQPSINPTNIDGGKRLTINVGSADTVNYTVKRNGTVVDSGSCAKSFQKDYKVAGKYTVTAYATRSGYTKSNTASKDFNIDKVAAPKITQSVKDDHMVVNISSDTSGATLFYTTSGNTPTVSSTRFNGALTLNEQKTVKAIAVKSGMANSDVSTTSIRVEEPETPGGLTLTGAGIVPMGESVNVKWNASYLASGYTATLYKSGTKVNSISTTGTTASFILPEEGDYSVNVYASNFVGNSTIAPQPVTVKAMAPSTVTFKDWDGSVVKTQEVPYGKNADLPSDPSRRGYSFLYWTNADKITGVKENLELTACYKINTYTVRFYNKSGNQVGPAQKVDYMKSADSPEADLNDIPTGYVFAGWKVLQASDESAGDYKAVDSDMKLQAVYMWFNNELPIVADIDTARQNVKTGNYNVSVKLTNYPKDTTTAILRVSLFTKDGKMVKSTKAEAEVDEDGNTTKTVTLKYSGVATKASAVVVGMNGDDLTSSAYSKEVTADVTVQTNEVWSDWSEWSTTKPDEAAGTEIESTTQHRYADKEFATSGSASMNGWTKYDSKNYWENDWGAWSGWSDTKQTGSDSRQVDTRKVYRYYCFLCPVCGAREPFTGGSDCRRYTLTQANAKVIWSTVPFGSCSPKGYSYTSKKKWTTSLGDGLRWNLSTADIGHTDIGYKGDAGTAIIKNQYRYRTRPMHTTYYFYKWKDWTDWGETVYTANDNRKVEKRTVYRSRKKVPVYSPLAGKEDANGSVYHITGKLSSVKEDLKGKLATIMVYKGRNSDPNEDQIQYVGQTTIAAGNSYDFNVIPKTDPTPVTGDFTVCLGVQGSTGLINVDVIRYKRQVYTVKYLNDDGTEIASQEVEEGANAKVPENPKKDGNRFTGWSGTATNVQENMNIVAIFEPLDYVVAFVDGANSIVSFENYQYGDKITPPEAPTADGKVFKGWDCILEGKDTVTDNMVANAVYDTEAFTVEFVDNADKVINTQKVEYGKAAVPPAALDIAGKEFLGWSTANEWWYVTENMTVKPILAFLQTADAPSYYTIPHDYDVAMYLETSTEDAKIYYTTDDSEPTIESQLYDGSPVILDSFDIEENIDEENKTVILHRTARVNAIAVKENMNDSEVQKIVYTDSVTLPMDVTEATVTFEANGGKELSAADKTRTIEIGEEYGELPVPTFEGYDFLGWFTGAEDGAQIGAEDVCYKDITLYAQWEKNNDVHVHTIVIDPAVEATCQQTGKTEGRHCSECNEVLVEQKEVPKADHKWDAGVVLKEATCTEDGEKIYTCEICAATKKEVLPAEGHTEEELPAIEATCSQAGKTAGTYCSVCGEIIIAQEDIPALAHTYGEWKSVKAATCKETGLEERFCENCGDRETRETEIINHTRVTKNASRATCTMEGYTGDVYCSSCGELLEEGQIIPKAEHSWGFGKTLEKATCIKEGKKVYTCEDCGEKKYEDTDKDPANHTGKTEIRNKKDATVTEEGYTGDTYCADCGEKLKTGKAIPVLPPENETSIRVQSNTVMAGKEITVSVTIDKNSGIAGFSFDLNYDKVILTLKKIDVGDVLANERLSTNGDVVNWYTSDNITGNGEILKLTFEVSEDAQAGETDISVTPRGGKKNLVDETGSYVDVNYQPGTLEIRRGLPGDVNSDGDITIGDVVIDNRHVLGKQILTDELFALGDVNGDGDITIGDVVILNRHVLGKQDLNEALAYLLGIGDYLGAGGSMTISVDDATVKPGETFNLPVWVEDNTGVAGMALKFTVPEGYTLNSITADKLLSKGTFVVDGNTCTWYAEKNVNSDGVLMTLNITAADTVKSGIVTVEAKDAEGNNLTDEHGSSMLVDFAAGSIIVDTSAGTAEDRAAADTVAEVIKALDSHDKDSVKAAKAQYDQLTDAQKSLISAEIVQKLTEAAESVAQEENKETAQKAADAIISIPSESALTLEDEAAVAAARAAYDKLSNDQKALVPPATVKALEAAEAKIAELKEKAAEDETSGGTSVTPGKTSGGGTSVTPEKPSGRSDAVSQPASIKVTNIILTGISKQIAAGKKIKLTSTVLPKNAANKNLKWSTSNKKVATVNQNGIVTIKKKTGGKTVIITAAATDGSGKKAQWKIKVMKGIVKKLTVKGAKTTLKPGKTMKLKATVKATKGANKKLQWTSSNKKYASVNSKGVVKALKAGKGKTVKITVMATDGSNVKKVVKFKIK